MRRHIQSELLPETRAQCYFFNSFFYKKLTEKSGAGSKAAEGQPALSHHERAFERVKKWTKARAVASRATRTCVQCTRAVTSRVLCQG